MGFTVGAIGDYVGGAIAGAGITTGEVSAGAAVVGAGVTAATALGGRRPVIPPSPVIGQQQQDESTEEAEANAQRRQSIAGGINSTVGTSGGQAGAMLNPANLGNKTLLGQ